MRQTLLTCLKKPPKSGKLTILATSSSVAVLEQLEMLDAFNVSFHVPTLQKAEALTVLSAMGARNIAQAGPRPRLPRPPVTPWHALAHLAFLGHARPAHRTVSRASTRLRTVAYR